MADVDAVVIGAGVVGLAVARALALEGREVLVLERHRNVGEETSSRNSEVIHSGIYYRPGSLKARLCVEGRDALYRYCEARNVPHRRVGKIIVAVDDAETHVLERYRATARANGAGELRLLGGAEIAELEPEVKALAALHAPDTGIVDSHALMLALWGDLQAAGGDVVFGAEVVGGRGSNDGFQLRVGEDMEVLTSRLLVNCAGLHASTVARRLDGCAGDRAPDTRYARGHYFTLAGRTPFRRLVYPVAESAGLGIHVTLDLAGRARFGPDVEWTTGIDYTFDEARRERFAAAIRRYFPALDADLLRPGYVGVRPKLSAPGAPPADFRIEGPESHGVPGLVQLYGIESPGLTACLAVADHVAKVLSAPP